MEGQRAILWSLFRCEIVSNSENSDSSVTQQTLPVSSEEGNSLYYDVKLYKNNTVL